MPRDGFGGMVVPPFGFLTGGTPAVPEFYWNVYSAEQRWKFLCVNLKRLCDFANQLNVNIGINADDIDKLEQEIASLKDGGWRDYYEQAVRDWIDNNLAWLWRTFAKQVFFGLNDDGYFVAYVPDSWADITFDTGMVYGRSDYGRLILRFTADDSLDNTYSYTLQQPRQFAQLLADIETTAKRGDASYNALFTNIDTEVTSSGNI